MRFRRTSVNQKVDNTGESTADTEEKHISLLIEAVKNALAGHISINLSSKCAATYSM